MADQTIRTLHSFLHENHTILSSGGTVKSYSHDHANGGPILCMVHGWPQSSYIWRHLVAALKDQISLFVVELPGYGASSLPPQHDKRTVGNLIIEALHRVFDPDRDVIWCGHDRGARIGHRLLVDASPTHHITAAILLDIVPTLEQWAAFSDPTAATAYYHWPFLATAAAPRLIARMGGDELVDVTVARTRGTNAQGVARLEEHGALAHYRRQFEAPDCIAGSCGDYAAGATVDCEEQERDQASGRKVSRPTLVVYSRSGLGRMHDVPKAWSAWVDGPVRYEGIEGGFGHYLPEECPEKVLPLVEEWIAQYGRAA